MINNLNPFQWRLIRRGFDAIRTRFFSVDVQNEQMKVDVSLEELRETLGRRHYTNSWELSYEYNGEDLNMRTPVYKEDEYNWYQHHVRAFERDGDVYVHSHVELEPTEHPYEHINEIGYSNSEGIDRMKQVIDNAGIKYKMLEE